MFSLGMYSDHVVKGGNVDLEKNDNLSEEMRNLRSLRTPRSVDWRDHGAVTPVKDQVRSLRGSASLKVKEIMF